MPRKRLIRTNEFPYHIVSRSNHKYWFNVPMSKVWKIFKYSYREANKKHPVILHGAVCMNNHYHMVIETPDANIDKFMFEFNSRFSRCIRIESNHINRMLGKRYHWSIVDTGEYYHHVMKYVFLNPVKAGIINDVRQYPYSTLYEELNNDFSLQTKPYLDIISPKFLKWLDLSHTKDEQDSINKGLRKGVFKPTYLPGKKVPPHFTNFKQ